MKTEAKGEGREGGEREHSVMRRKRRKGGRWLLRDSPLIIHGALSTPIEGENRSCEPESNHHAHPPSSPCPPLSSFFFPYNPAASFFFFKCAAFC